MNIRNACKITLATVSLTLASGGVFASGGGATFVEGVNYLPIKPPVVVNYGNSGVGKVKYIKAEISLRVEDAHSAEEVSHHMPLIRDTLIMLLSTATDEQMSSGEGKDEMRTEALEKVNEAIEEQIAAGLPKTRSKKSAHGKSEAATDEHGKKDEHAKSDRPKRTAKKSAASHGPVTDLLFDNLVVQK